MEEQIAQQTSAVAEQPRIAAQRVQVDIFGQQYWLRSDGDGEYVEELARYVDGLMQDLSSKSSSTDSLKIAIMAALNMADELHSLEEFCAEQDANVVAVSEECSAVLDEVLNSKRPEREPWDYQEVFKQNKPADGLRAKISARLVKRRLMIQGLTDDDPSDSPSRPPFKLNPPETS